MISLSRKQTHGQWKSQLVQPLKGGRRVENSFFSPDYENKTLFKQI